MIKRIFSIIGVVVGMAGALIGATAGVLALQGKFSVPTVYPNELVFMNNEQEIIDYGDSGTIYYFTLTGNANSEHEVNKKDCLIEFLEGNNLISLCNSKGVNLEPNANNRYLVQCNEPIYYKLKDVSKEILQGDSFGKVVLQARDVNNTLKSNKQTIWIDRNIEKILLDVDEVDKQGVQTVEVGVDVEQDFTFKTTPDYAIRPHSNELAKIVETYVVDSSKSDYIPLSQAVTEYDYIHEKSAGEYYFKADKSGTYTFKIAVFPSYKEKRDYEASAAAAVDAKIERVKMMTNTTLVFNVVNSEVTQVGINSTEGISLNLNAENNYLTLNGTSGKPNVNNQNLKLSMIKDGRVTDIRFNEVNFDINNSQIWLDKDDSEIKFAKLDANNVASDEFVLKNKDIENIDAATSTIKLTDGTEYQYQLGNISTNGKAVITSLTFTTKDETPLQYTYYCVNGLAFVDETNEKLSLMTAGSYLDFFIYDSNTETYTQVGSKLSYSIEGIEGSRAGKTFNILAKNIPQLSGNETLVIGAIVVNSTGGKSPLFASTNVSVNKVDLQFDYVNGQERNIEVEYERDDDPTTPDVVEYKTVYGSLTFNNIINVTQGSYNACVFVTLKSSDGKYNVETMENIVYNYNDTEYVLVGYLNERDEYVNAVKPSAGAKHNSETEIYVLQLINSYGETADGIINTALNDAVNKAIEEGVADPNKKDMALTLGIEEGNIQTGASFINELDKVTVVTKYELDASKLSLDFKTQTDGIWFESYSEPVGGMTAPSVHVLERGQGYKLTLTSTIPNMIKNVYTETFLEDYFTAQVYDKNGNILDNVAKSNIKINVTSTNPPEENSTEWVIILDVEDSFMDSLSYAKVIMNYPGINPIESCPIYIQSSKPNDIDLVYNISGSQTEVLNLSEDSTEAEDSANYILIEKVYESGEIKHNYYIVINNDLNNKISIDGNTFFNSVSNELTESGFIATPKYMINKTLEYSVANSAVLTFGGDVDGYYIVAQTGIGEDVINVRTTEGVSRYIKVIVDASKFSLLINNNAQQTTGEQFYLTSDHVEYSYDTTKIENAALLDISNVEVNNFGGGVDYEIEEGKDEILIHSVEASPVNILRITREADSWKFHRENYLNAQLKITFNLSASTLREPATMSITFKSNLEYSVNPEWENVRQGTTVLVYEQVEGGQEFQYNPIVKVTTHTENLLQYKLLAPNGTIVTSESGCYEFTQVGRYEFEIYSSSSLVTTIMIQCVPNIEIKTSTLDVVSYVSDYNLRDNIIMEACPTSTIIYGKTKTNGVDFDMYNNVTKTSTYPSDLVYELETPNDLITIDSGKLSVGWIENIDETVKVNLTVSSGYVKVGVVELNIANKFSVLNNVINSGAEIISKTEYKLPVFGYDNGVVTFTPNDVKIEIVSSGEEELPVLTFETLEDYRFFTLSTSITEELEFALKFTYINTNGTEDTRDDQQLIYVTPAVKLVPYIPLLKQNVKAYTGSEFDFINDVFTADINKKYREVDTTVTPDSTATYYVVENNEYVEVTNLTAWVSGVTYYEQLDADIVDRIAIKSLSRDNIILGSVGSLGQYYKGAATNSAVATIASIVGDSETIIVTYTITYVDNVKYEFNYELTVLNQYTLNLNVPFVDNAFSITANFIAVDGEEYEVYNNALAEPVLISSNKEATITFKYDSVYSLYRALVAKTKNPNEYVYNDRLTIKLVAYQNKPEVIGYYKNNVYIDNENGTVTFKYNSSMANSYGYLIFKVTTSTGAFRYYYVYLYNNEDYNDVDVNASESYQGKTSDNKFIADEDKTNVADGVKLLGHDVADYDDRYVRYYIMDAYNINEESLFNMTYDHDSDTETEEIPYFNRYELITEDTILPVLNNYATLKIAKVYVNGSIKFCFGVDLFHVRPQVTEEVTNAALKDYYYWENNDKLPDTADDIYTGEYRVELASVATSFAEPFTVAGTLEAEFKGEFNSDIVRLETDGTLTLLDRVTEDYKFTVKYIYNSEFTLLVHFTFKATEVSTAEADATVGEFVDGFNNKYNLTWLNNYASALQLPVIGDGVLQVSVDGASAVTLDGGVAGSVGQVVDYKLVDKTVVTTPVAGKTYYTFEGSYYQERTDLTAWTGDDYYEARIIFKKTASDEDYYLEFTQETEDYEVELLFTYSGVLGNPTKQVNVTVLSGLHYEWLVETAENNVSGETNATSYKLSAIGSYAESTGSKLDVTYAEAGYYSYTIGSEKNGLRIYTSEASKINVNYNSNIFVNETGTGKTVNGANDVINFTHSATEAIVALTISIQTAHNENYTTIYQNTPQNVSLDFYVTVAKTYTGLKAIYYTTGSTHENVNRARIFSLDDLFTENTENSDVAGESFINKYRVAVVNGSDVTTEYSPVNMGFTNVNNPNYIGCSTSNGGTYYSVSGRNLTFTNSDLIENVFADLVLTNRAGIEGDNKLVYAFQIMKGTDRYAVNGEVVSDSVTYATKLIEDKANSSEFDSKEFTIMNLKDSNSSVAYLTNVTTDLSGASLVGSVTNNYNIVDENGYKYKEYTLTHTVSDKTLTLILRIYEDERVTARLIRGKDYTLFDTAKFTFSLYSDEVNKVVDDFSLIFVNYDFNIQYSEEGALSDIVDAGAKINLDNKIVATKHKDGNSASYTKALVSGSYTDGIVTIQLDTADKLTSNNLYDFANNIISTHTVVKDTDLYLNIKISVDGYHVKLLTYHLTVNCNLEFKVNGSALLHGNNYFTTNYLLTDANLADGAFLHNDDLTTATVDEDNDNKPTVEITTNDYFGYYTDLKVELFVGSKSSKYTVRVHDNYKAIVSYSGSTLTFKEDYTGTVKLYLVAETAYNGNYEVEWEINTVGLLTIKYNTGISENTINRKNGNPYEAGASDVVVMSAATSGVALNYENNDITTDTTLIDSNDVVVNYVVIPYQNSLTDVATIYSNADNKNSLTSSFVNEELKVTLPFVSEHSIVICKVTVTYEDRNYSRDFYACYDVEYDVTTITVQNSEFDASASELNDNKNLILFKGSEVSGKAVFATDYGYDKLNFNAVKLSNMSGYNGGESVIYYQVKLEPEESKTATNWYYYIDLTAPYKTYDPSKTDNNEKFSDAITLEDGKLFNNSLTATLELMYNNATALTVNNFKLTASGALAPKKKTYMLSDIFQSGVLTDYEIVEIYATGANPTASLVDAENASAGTAVETIVYGKIGENDAKYEVIPVTYTGSASDGIYNIQSVFYCLKAPSGKVVTIDFISNSTENSLFYVTDVITDGNGIITGMDIDLQYAFKEYVMDSNTGIRVNYCSSKEIKEVGATEPITGTTITISKGELMVAADAGQRTLKVTYQVVADGVTIEFDVVFALNKFLVAKNSITVIANGTETEYSVIGTVNSNTDTETALTFVSFANGQALTEGNTAITFGNVSKQYTDATSGITYDIYEVTYKVEVSSGVYAERTFNVGVVAEAAA